MADTDGSIIDGLEGQWQPIVDVDLWRRVNLRLNDPDRSPGRGFTPRILSGGIARCGVCGWKMRSNTSGNPATGERYKILRCSNPKRVDNLRHPSARVSDVDAMMRQQIIYAFALGPAQLFQQDNDTDVLALERELATFRTKRADVLDLLEAQVITKAEATARLSKYATPMESIQKKLNELVSTSASAHMLVDLRAGFVDPDTHTASLEGFEKLEEELAKRFDALPIEQRRRLADTLLDVRVRGGRGKQKYDITHKIVTTLNEETSTQFENDR